MNSKLSIISLYQEDGPPDERGRFDVVEVEDQISALIELDEPDAALVMANWYRRLFAYAPVMLEVLRHGTKCERDELLTTLEDL